MKKIDKLPSDYALRMQLAQLKTAEENAERLKLDNDKKRIDIDRTTSNLCYIDTATQEFNKALSAIAVTLKGFDQILAQKLDLDGPQTEVVTDAVNELLAQLADIEICLSTTNEIDAQIAHSSIAEKEIRKKRATSSK